MVAHSVPFVGGEEVVQTNPCVLVLTACQSVSDQAQVKTYESEYAKTGDT